MTTNVSAQVSQDAQTAPTSETPNPVIDLGEMVTPMDRYKAKLEEHGPAIDKCHDLTVNWSEWFRGCMVELQKRLTYNRTLKTGKLRQLVTLQAPLDKIQSRHVDTGVTAKYIPKLNMGNGDDVIRCDGEFVIGTAVIENGMQIMSDIETLARAAKALATLEVEWLKSGDEGKGPQTWAEEQSNIREMSRQLFLVDEASKAKDDAANVHTIEDTYANLRLEVLEVLLIMGANPRAATHKPKKDQKGKGTITFKDIVEKGGYPSITYRSLKEEKAEQVNNDPPKVLVTTNQFAALPEEVQAMLTNACVELELSTREKKEKKVSVVGNLRSSTNGLITAEALQAARKNRS